MRGWAGCLPGEERFFEDASGEVRSLRVNAYSKEGAAPDAIVETRGVGSDNLSRAFSGTLVLLLERQATAGNGSEATYSEVRRWTLSVDADDFSSPTLPYHEHVVPAATFPAAGTYRVTAAAKVGETELPPASALFAWPHR
jgi:hypothetical protein